MKKPIFTGVCTALVTPFLGETLNTPMLRQLIRRQEQAGIDALVICGTTGESATLSDGEKTELFRVSREAIPENMAFLAGTGSNDTAHAVALSQAAEGCGADGLLVVSPYYNKATQQGLLRHYKVIADSVGIPIILYNVPSRTGCNLLPATVEKLAEHPNIAAIKEASGNMSQVVELFARCGDKITVYSGEDGLTVPMLAMGGMGTISVLSNVVPKQAVAMTDAFFTGRVQEAADWQCKLLPLINDLFCEVNPIPAKAAVSAMGYGEEHIRLPLTPMEPENRAKLFAEMRKQGVNV